MSVVVSSKDPMMRDALESLLKNEGGFNVIASESRVTAALSAAKVNRAMVVVVDDRNLDDKDYDRLSAARSKTSVYVLLVTDALNREGVHGKVADRLVQRDKGANGLLKSVGDIVNRDRVRRFSVRESTRGYGAPYNLTSREFEVAKKVGEGLSNRDIADQLDLAEQTVKNLVSVVMRKLACKNRVQVALRLSREGDTAKD